MKKVIFIGLIISLVIISCAKKEKQSPIEGTWQMIEYSSTSPDTSFANKPSQPGLFIFGKDYYSMIYVSSNEPRPLLPDDYSRSTLTDEQIKSSFMDFVANSGKYELDGSKITVSITVALEPNYMTGGSAASEYEFRIENDTMWLTRTSTGTGSVRYYTLKRLEL